MTTNEMKQKVRENLIRRMSVRQGLFLHKTRRIDPFAIDYGTYSLLDQRKKVVAGLDHVSLDEIEAFLTDKRRLGGTKKRKRRMT